MTRTEQKRAKELKQAITAQAKKTLDIFKDPETLKNKPYFLKGSGVRNWAKKTPKEKREIIRNVYAGKVDKAIKEINDAITSAETLENFTARVEWHKSQTWGYNPTAETWGNNSNYGSASASGCGYDKLSAAICSSLSEKTKELFKTAIIKSYVKTGAPLPYGVYIWASGISLDFGGCGVETLTSILKYCGLNARTVSGKMFDYIETI